MLPPFLLFHYNHIKRKASNYKPTDIPFTQKSKPEPTDSVNSSVLVLQRLAFDSCFFNMTSFFFIPLPHYAS